MDTHSPQPSPSERNDAPAGPRPWSGWVPNEVRNGRDERHGDPPQLGLRVIFMSCALSVRGSSARRLLCQRAMLAVCRRSRGIDVTSTERPESGGSPVTLVAAVQRHDEHGPHARAASGSAAGSWRRAAHGRRCPAGTRTSTARYARVPALRRRWDRRRRPSSGTTRPSPAARSRARRSAPGSVRSTRGDRPRRCRAARTPAARSGSASPALIDVVHRRRRSPARTRRCRVAQL